MYGLNNYQQEQLQALIQIRDKLAQMDTATIERIKSDIVPYLEFRRELQCFMDAYLGGYCTRACFESRTSACCSRDGIITFWADAVINVIHCDDRQLDEMEQSIRHPFRKEKCIYLSDHGCRWEIRPLVCAMFICDSVQVDVIDVDPKLTTQWQMLNDRSKAFRWPERPVLFDSLELIFMERGCRSPLMYINTSPGLLRIKRKAGF